MLECLRDTSVCLRNILQVQITIIEHIGVSAEHFGTFAEHTGITVVCIGSKVNTVSHICK
jgi:hypothetical protein